MAHNQKEPDIPIDLQGESLVNPDVEVCLSRDANGEFANVLQAAFGRMLNNFRGPGYVRRSKENYVQTKGIAVSDYTATRSYFMTIADQTVSWQLMSCDLTIKGECKIKQKVGLARMTKKLRFKARLCDLSILINASVARDECGRVCVQSIPENNAASLGSSKIERFGGRAVGWLPRYFRRRLANAISEDFRSTIVQIAAREISLSLEKLLRSLLNDSLSPPLAWANTTNVAELNVTPDSITAKHIIPPSAQPKNLRLRALGPDKSTLNPMMRYTKVSDHILNVYISKLYENGDLAFTFHEKDGKFELLGGEVAVIGRHLSIPIPKGMRRLTNQDLVLRVKCSKMPRAVFREGYGELHLDELTVVLQTRYEGHLLFNARVGLRPTFRVDITEDGANLTAQFHELPHVQILCDGEMQSTLEMYDPKPAHAMIEVRDMIMCTLNQIPVVDKSGLALPDSLGLHPDRRSVVSLHQGVMAIGTDFLAT